MDGISKTFLYHYASQSLCLLARNAAFIKIRTKQNAFGLQIKGAYEVYIESNRPSEWLCVYNIKNAQDQRKP
jgi:hypothetical protein